MSGEKFDHNVEGYRRRLVDNTETQPSFPFDSLPHAVFLKILSLLSIEELGRAALVSKLWNDKCLDPSLWRKLPLDRHKLRVTDEVLERLTNLGGVVITHLNISECRQISANCVLECLKRCVGLEEIRVARCRAFQDACLECIGQTSRRLKTIDMSLCLVSDEGVQKLCQGCPNLESITMNQCTKLTHKSLHHLAANCPKLAYISVEYNNQMNDDGLERLVQECSALHTLHLNSCGITREGVQAIALNCHKLVVLDVQHCLTLDDETVRHLALYCPKLQVLNLSLCYEVTDVSIEHILKFCGNLRHLFIVHCKITDQGLQFFTTLTPVCTLERLDLSRCQDVTDAGVRHVVRGCRSLKHLGLVQCDKVSDETVLSLSCQHPELFLSTLQTEMNRVFNKTPLQDGTPPT